MAIGIVRNVGGGGNNKRGLDFLQSDISKWSTSGNTNIGIVPNVSFSLVVTNGGSINADYQELVNIKSGMKIYWNISASPPQGALGNLEISASIDDGVTWTSLAIVNSVNNPSGNNTINIEGKARIRLRGYSGGVTAIASVLTIH